MAKATARHILVASEDKCNELKAQIEGGADFAEVAKANSTCPSSRQGGDLGSFGPGQMVKEFDTVVFSAPINVVQGPVKTQFGYHLIRLTDRSEPHLRDFQSVKKMVEERLVNERRTKAFKEYVEKLKGNVKVDVDEIALEKTSFPVK